MELAKEFLKQAPKIIKEAATSPLGIVALVVLALSVLGYSFFSKSSDAVKTLNFFAILASCVFFVFIVFRRAQEVRGEERSLPPAPAESDPVVTAPRRPPGPSAPDSVSAISRDTDKISIAKLPITGEHLFGREEELKRLDAAWAEAGTNVISLVAWGGVGKSALVNHWLGRMAKDNYRGAARVYGWSFYSQGARETAASADPFIDAALRWFGDPDPAEGSPLDKGARLAHLVRQERTLLILDGLEPLQHPPGPDGGRLKDPGLAALVRELAAANPGLCVVTTRHKVADIGPHAGTTAPVIDLENLPEEAGAQLLQALGVNGSDGELRRASREFGGHGLALNLLGTY